MKVLSSSAYQFKNPGGVAAAGEDLFVANAEGNSVTDLPL